MKIYEGTFYDQLREAERRYSTKTALICEEKRLTYHQLLRMSENAAVKLCGSGLKKGDRVVIWGSNSLEWVIAFYAVTIAGGTAVLMNYGVRAEEAGAMAKMVNAAMLLYGHSHTLINHPDSLNVMIHTAEIRPQHVIPFSALIQNEAAADDFSLLSDRQIQSRETQVIIFTTGTTSRPKAVQLSAYSILNDAIAAYEMFEGNVGKCTCNALPLFHSYGLIVLQVYLYCGRTVCLMPEIKAEIIADLVKAGVTDDMASVGAVYAMLTRLPDFLKNVSGRLKLCIVGGGFTAPEEMVRLERAFDGAWILCGYGQTECSPVISVEVPEDPLSLRSDSVGHILPELDVRIWQKEKGEVPTGETGEIIVKGYCTMNGYDGESAEDDPFDENGYLHTGDIGYLTEDGMLHLTGRMKEIIVRCGENVSPTEVEQALLSIEGIRAAKVMGAFHEIWGESVEACVMTESLPKDEKEAEQTIQNALREKLSSYKVPSHILFFESFPMTSTGKTDSRELKAILSKRLQPFEK